MKFECAACADVRKPIASWAWLIENFVIRKLRRSWRAIRSAMASVSLSSSARGTSLFTKPSSSASSASMNRFSKRTSFDFLIPRSQGAVKSCTCAGRKRASSAAMIRSMTDATR